jgi:hypothetical protein
VKIEGQSNSFSDARGFVVAVIAMFFLGINPGVYSRGNFWEVLL